MSVLLLLAVTLLLVWIKHSLLSIFGSLAFSKWRLLSPESVRLFVNPADFSANFSAKFRVHEICKQDRYWPDVFLRRQRTSTWRVPICGSSCFSSWDFFLIWPPFSQCTGKKYKSREWTICSQIIHGDMYRFAASVDHSCGSSLSSYDRNDIMLAMKLQR